MGHVVRAAHFLRARVLQRPQLRGQRARRRLDQRGEVDVVGAEAHAELAQRGAGVLRQGFQLLGDLGALQHPQRFADLEGDAARDAVERFARFQLLERAEQLLDVLRDPQVEAALHHLQRRAGQLLVGDDAHVRLEDVRTGCDAPDRLAEPADQPVVGQHEGLVHRLVDAGGAALDLGGQRLLRGGVQRARLLARGLRVGGEAEAVELADVLAFHHHVAAGGDFGFHDRILS